MKCETAILFSMKRDHYPRHPPPLPLTTLNYALLFSSTPVDMEKISLELLDFDFEWDVCLSVQLQPDAGARIMRCEAQMERFDFFFALHLGKRLYSHTDNLSKHLQGTKMAAVRVDNAM